MAMVLIYFLKVNRLFERYLGPEIKINLSSVYH